MRSGAAACVRDLIELSAGQNGAIAIDGIVMRPGCTVIAIECDCLSRAIHFGLPHLSMLNLNHVPLDCVSVCDPGHIRSGAGAKARKDPTYRERQRQYLRDYHQDIGDDE